MLSPDGDVDAVLAPLEDAITAPLGTKPCDDADEDARERLGVGIRRT